MMFVVVMLTISLLLASTSAFTVGTAQQRRQSSSGLFLATAGAAAMAEAGVPATTSEPDTEDVNDDGVPTNLPSDCGMDYVPLATMLATGQLAEADQVRLYF